MAYQMYLADVLMPVTPEKVSVKINNQNQTFTLISGEEINVLQSAGLTSVTFDLMLPHVPYPFANGTVQSAQFYLSHLERLKKGKQPFQWILNRSKPDGSSLFFSNLTVGLEEYEIKEDASEGFDIIVSVKLKQWNAYGIKKVNIKQPTAPNEKAKASVQNPPREQSNAPKASTYTVQKGDSLWNIAKKHLGDGAKYTEIYNLNKDKIKNPNLIDPGQVLTLPNEKR